MLQSDARQGIRLTLGYSIGFTVGLGLLATTAAFIEALVVRNGTDLVWLAAVAVVALAACDALHAPPSLRRQTPKMLIHRLSPALTGFVWGADIGVLVTTVKVTSLLWAALIIGFALPEVTLSMVFAVYWVASLSLHWAVSVRIALSARPMVTASRLSFVSNRPLRRGSAIVLGMSAALLALS